VDKGGGFDGGDFGGEGGGTGTRLSVIVGAK